MWLTKTSKRKMTGAPKLKSFPPTPEAFEQTVKRAHYQVCVWNAALQNDPPDLSPTCYGLGKDKATKSLVPDVLRLRRCCCASDQPCSNGRCTCTAAQLSCTTCCACHGDEECCNKWTIKDSQPLCRSKRY